MGGKAGTERGVAVRRRCKQDTRPSTVLSDLAKAAVMGSRGAWPLLSRGGEQAREDGQPRPETGLTIGPWSSTPARPGIRPLESYRCPDATLGPSGGAGPRRPTASTPIPSSASLHSGAQAGLVTVQHVGSTTPQVRGASWMGNSLLLQLHEGAKGLHRPCLYTRTTWCPARSEEGHPPATSQCRWPASGRQASPDPMCTTPVTGHARRPAPLRPIRTAGPHLLGLSLRLVLRALKLSFSGVSSKGRRTLERRPWRSGANLSHRQGD